ncbi:MAG: Gfo/Idh/MocA family protein [Bacillota bacterium]
MKNITFAVVGSGFMGQIIAEAASELPYTQCVGAVDVDIKQARTLVEKCGGNAYASPEEMLAKEKPEAVFIATPEVFHREPALAAIKAGANLFVEKPLAVSLEDADAIIKAAKAAGLKLMTGHILRFEQTYAMIKSAIDEGSIGKFRSAYARRVATIDEARRLKGRISPLTYIGVHDFDQFLWYHPMPVKSVFARAIKGRVQEELGVYDVAWVMIEFADGALGIEEVGWCLPEEWAKWQQPSSWGGFGDVRMNVIGTEGALNINLTPMDLYGCNREGWKFPDTRHWPKMHGKINGALKAEVEHFFDCILYDREPLSGGENGRRAVEIMLAAERSIAEDRVISLPL